MRANGSRPDVHRLPLRDQISNLARMLRGLPIILCLALGVVLTIAWVMFLSWSAYQLVSPFLS